MNNLKILLLGPVESGKSYIANVISEAIEQTSGHYRPTQGVRILEYEFTTPLKGKNVKTCVQLWDVSGDPRYENCWPAIMKATNGAVFVYNPDQHTHEKELEELYQKFVEVLGLKPSQCCIVCNKKPNSSDRDIVQLPAMFDKIRGLKTNFEEDGGDQFREEFARFMSQLSLSLKESSEQEEMSIMNR